MSGHESIFNNHVWFTKPCLMAWLSYNHEGVVQLKKGIKYSIEASSSINTGVETTCSHLAD